MRVRHDPADLARPSICPLVQRQKGWSGAQHRATHYRVVLLVARHQAPITSRCDDRHAQCPATTNEATITGWWRLWPDALPGIPLARVGFVVVDADKRDFRPQAEEPFSPPCLGAVLEYRTKCYRGMEEHGLEVISVDPRSGAARAGLQGQTRATALGIAGGIGGALLGPLELMVLPLLQRSGALGTGGDLVLAVDDIRVRDVNEFQKAMRALKPGDSVYLTVIRPVRGGGHQTLRIRVNLDSCSNADVVQGPIWREDEIRAHSRSLN